MNSIDTGRLASTTGQLSDNKNEQDEGSECLLITYLGREDAIQKPEQVVFSDVLTSPPSAQLALTSTGY